jgi:hypothetical protein
MRDQPPALAIKLNNCASNDPCALCGFRTDPEVGPELFLEGTWALVCYGCGEKYAPSLVELLMKLRHAEYEQYMAELASEQVADAPQRSRFPEGDYWEGHFFPNPQPESHKGDNVVQFPRQTEHPF